MSQPKELQSPTPHGEWTQRRINTWRHAMKAQFVNAEAIDAICDLAINGLSAPSEKTDTRTLCRWPACESHGLPQCPHACNRDTGEFKAAERTPDKKSRPVIYGLMNDAGEFHMSESCIAFTAAELDAELEHLQEGDDTWRIVPLFAVSAIAPTWIARSDRMPAASTHVLLTNGEWISTGYFSGKHFLIDIQHESDTGLTPTHWMPLPSALSDGKAA